MPDFLLIIRLVSTIFIFDKKSLHYPSRKRILFVLFVSPILTLIIIINQLFLLLDNLFFFPYRWIKIQKSAFIVGVPRSATTYMLELLSRDKNFTSFRLWEIIFAPSIIQKLFALVLIRIDYQIGRPLYKLSKWIDRKVVNIDFKHIHNLELALPEEDEPLMIYDFSSLYLYYLFPEAKAMKPYLFFDEEIPPKKRKRIMKFYYRCVQRHQFVFNQNGKKIFLSKNPAFVAKINSLNETFENCNIIYMLRSPLNTIPSTISLNEHIFDAFSNVKNDVERNTESRKTIIKWYKMSLEALSKIPPSRKKMVLFKKFIENPSNELKELYQILNLNPLHTPTPLQQTLITERKKYKSKHNYNPKTGLLNDSDYELLKELHLLNFNDSI